MMAKRDKGGKKLRKPKQEKTRRIIQPEVDRSISSDLDRNPKFSFRRLSPDFDLSNCDRDQKAALIDKLRILGALTWRLIIHDNKDANGFEMIPIDQIKGNMSTITEDITKVMIFRFNGKKCRLVGVQVSATFYIVWIDPHLDLYEH